MTGTASLRASGRRFREFNGEANLLARALRSGRLTVLLGASGVGKTTLLLAEVLPLLRRRVGDELDSIANASPVVMPFPDRRSRAQGRGEGERLHFVDRWNEPSLDVLARELSDVQAPAAGRIGLAQAMSPAHLSALSQRRGGARLLFVFDHFESLIEGARRDPDLERLLGAWATAVETRDLDANFLVAVDEQAWPQMTGLLAARPAGDLRAFRLQERSGRRVLEPLTDDQDGRAESDSETTSTEFQDSIGALLSKAAQSARSAAVRPGGFESSLGASVSRVSGLVRAAGPSPTSASNEAAGQNIASGESAELMFPAIALTRAPYLSDPPREHDAAAQGSEHSADVEGGRRVLIDLQAIRLHERSARRVPGADVEAVREETSRAAEAAWAAKAAEAMREAAAARTAAELGAELAAQAQRLAQAQLAAEVAKAEDTERRAQAAEAAAAREMTARQAAEATATAAQAERLAEAAVLAEAKRRSDDEHHIEATRQADAVRQAVEARQAEARQLAQTLAAAEETVARERQARQAADAAAKTAVDEQRAENKRRAEAERRADEFRQAEAAQRAETRRLTQALADAEAAWAAKAAEATREAAAARTAAELGAELAAKAEREAQAQLAAEVAKAAEAERRAQAAEAAAAHEMKARQEAAATATAAQAERLAEAALLAEAKRRAEEERRIEINRQAHALRQAEEARQAEARKLAQALAAAEAAATRERQARQTAEAAAKAAADQQWAEAVRRAEAEQRAHESSQAEAAQRAETQRLTQALADAEAQRLAVGIAAAGASAARETQSREAVDGQLPALEELPTRLTTTSPMRPRNLDTADSRLGPDPATARPARPNLLWRAGAVAALAAAVLWWFDRRVPPATPMARSTEAAAPLPGADSALGRSPASADTSAPAPPLPGRYELVGSNAGSTHSRLALELAGALSNTARAVQVVPAPDAPDAITGLQTQGRLAIVRFDTLRAARGTAAAPLRVLTPLFPQEVLFIVRADSPLKYIHELRGRRLGIGPALGDEAPTVRAMYRSMFDAEMTEPMQVDNDQALAELVAFRSIDAMAIVDPQPSVWWASLGSRTKRELRLLTLDTRHPADQRLLQTPGTSRAPAGTGSANDKQITTPAVMSFLVTSGSGDADAERMKTMAAALCRELPRLRKSAHPKWRELQTKAELDSGWPVDQQFRSALDRCMRR